jgi:hypothetical protein
MSENDRFLSDGFLVEYSDSDVILVGSLSFGVTVVVLFEVGVTSVDVVVFETLIFDILSVDMRNVDGLVDGTLVVLIAMGDVAVALLMLDIILLADVLVIDLSWV